MRGVTLLRARESRRSPPHHTSVKRFQYGILAGPEGALLYLLPYEFEKAKDLSQRHPSICRLRQIDIKHLVLGGVEGDTSHLLLAAVLPVLDRLQGAPLQAFLRPLDPFAAAVEPGEVLDLLLPERMRYPEFGRQHLFVGSGVIEAGCKTVIASQLKRSSMFWSLRGANAIVALRCCRLGGQFEDYWQVRRA